MKPKQKRFVDEYLIDLNATAAYRRAGYNAESDNAAAASAAKLLRNPEIQAALDAAMGDRARRTEVKADQVLRELAAIGFSNIVDFIDYKNGFIIRRDVDPSAWAAVQSIKVRHELGGDGRPAAEIVEFKLWSKTDALKQLAQHLGLLKEVHEHKGSVGLRYSDFDDLTEEELDDRIRELEEKEKLDRLERGERGASQNVNETKDEPTAGPM